MVSYPISSSMESDKEAVIMMGVIGRDEEAIPQLGSRVGAGPIEE